MTRIYGMKKKLLRLRIELTWSLSEEGHTGQDIADIFNLEKSWVNRKIKEKPKHFKSLLVPVVK